MDQEVQDDFHEHLDKVWIPFACNVLKSFVQYGFVPYLIVKKHMKGTRKHVKYPLVVPFGSYTIRQTQDDNYETTYALFKTSNQAFGSSATEDKRVNIVFFENGTRPTSDGDINTPIASLIPILTQLDHFLAYEVRATQMRTHPTLVLENSPSGRNFEEVVQFEAFPGSNTVDQMHDERRSAAQMHSIRRSQEYADALNSGAQGGGRPSHTSSTGSLLNDNSRLYRENIYALPDGKKIASGTPQAQVRSDLILSLIHI